MSLLAAGLLAIQPIPASEDWWYFSVLGDVGGQQAFYIDLSSIRRAGDLVTVEEAREGERADEQGIVGARLLVRYDCRARTSQVLRYTFIQSDGQRWTATRAQDSAEIVGEESTSENSLKIACGETEGIEQLGRLGIRDQAMLLFDLSA